MKEEISFPEGSILLSGAVGSGKSSILLGLDFVLFGLRSGSLAGGSLLRNGEDKGSVELHFHLDGDDIKIRRNLKKNANTIAQEPGFIEINGRREDLSPIELKDRVLSLLNYPKELLTKNKSLIYRYTVYTPQEEMKLILFADKEHRLEILRKVFGFDKYKRIKDNGKLFVQYLKGKRKELAGRIFDLDDKIKIREEKDGLVNNLKNKILNLDNEITNLDEKLKKKEKEIEDISKQVELLKELKKQKEIFELDVLNKANNKNKNNVEIEKLKIEIKNLTEIIKEAVKVDKVLILEKRTLVESFEKKISERNAKLGALSNRISYSEEIKEQITSLDICPTCKQKVTKEHINAVMTEENSKTENTKKEMLIIENEIKNLDKELNEAKFVLEEIKQQESSFELFELRKKYLDEKKSLLIKFEDENKKLKDEISNLETTTNILEQKLISFRDVEGHLNSISKEKETLYNDKKKLEIDRHGFNTELNSILKSINELINEIESKKKDKNELLYWTNIQTWLEEYFVNIMDLIEKNVLFKVHNDFNSLFKNWFELLMGEESIKVDLDEEFTPIVEQAGHVIEFEYLSGGEKTAAALSYRLALNQVINLLMSVIKTRDLLILDEPTDGFSDLQIERIRTVLKELNIGQVIIVSHEDKIESFVDHVIEIRKIDNVSGVVLP